MRTKENRFGQCHLCGKQESLSFEHIPPQKAFNSSKVYTSKGVDLIGRKQVPWDPTGVKRKQHQSGIGDFTLCGRCNSLTGAWYGSSFVDFIYKGLSAIINKPLQNYSVVEIPLRGIKPLNVIKQIISMFFSVNDSSFASHNPELRDFVLYKNNRSFNPFLYKVQMHVFIGAVARQNGIASSFDTITGENHVFSEVSWPPFGYILEFDAKFSNKYTNISHFANEYKYNQVKDIVLRLPVLESNTGFPGDTRSKSEILKTGETNPTHMYFIHDQHFKNTNLK